MNPKTSLIPSPIARKGLKVFLHFLLSAQLPLLQFFLSGLLGVGNASHFELSSPRRATMGAERRICLRLSFRLSPSLKP